MKNSYKLILGLAVFSVFAGLVWRLKAPVPLQTAPAQPKITPSSTPAATARGKPSQPAPAAAMPSHPDVSLGGNAAPQRKFDEMPASERRAILGEIRKQDFDSIIRAWLKAGRVENDPAKQGSITTVWGFEMGQRTVPPEVYEKMRAIMADSTYSIHERGNMIGVLASAATPEAASLLIYEATTQTDEEMKRMATFALRGLGDTFNEANAALLEPLWKESNDPVMMQSVARSIGKIGKASSVELLFSEALSAGGPDDVRGEAAWDGLREVHRENAIPPLVAALEKNPVGSPANKLALDTLGQIVGKKAPQAVMKWLQASDSSAAPLATAWVTNATLNGPLEAAQAALNPSVPFRSEANREAIRKGLDAYHAGNRTFVP